MKQTSAKLAKLAVQILKGYEPNRSEIETLAAAIIAQRESVRNEKRRAAIEKIAAEEAARNGVTPAPQKTSWVAGLFEIFR